MKTLATLVAAVVATTALTSAVYALDQTKVADKTMQQDFNKLSKDGFKAMLDVRDARLAIFNAQPDKAKTNIADAQKALAAAKTDDTSFLKAEAVLKPPANVKQKSEPSDAAATTTPVAWLPINGALGIDEDFSASPTKASGVAKANTQLKNGQHKEALETLRLNEVNMSFVMEVAPLEKTIQGVDQASQLINSGKYYEANQALKGVEDGTRYDVVDMSGTPKAAATTTQPSTSTSGMAIQPKQAAPTTAPDKK